MQIITTKRFSIKVNNNIYDLNLQTELDILLDKMGMSSVSDEKMDNVKAPMPGLVLDILVEAGQTINKGDNLIGIRSYEDGKHY
jgi:biotin carboxyl carrier protein